MKFWACGDGANMWGCARCGQCLEHCRCKEPVAAHILTRAAQLAVIRSRDAMRDRVDPGRPADLDNGEEEQ